MSPTHPFEYSTDNSSRSQYNILFLSSFLLFFPRARILDDETKGEIFPLLNISRLLLEGGG